MHVPDKKNVIITANGYVYFDGDFYLMAKHKNKPSVARTLIFLLAGLAGLGLCIALILKDANIAVMNVKGLMASEQRGLIVFSTLFVLAIAVPVVLFLYFIAWKYRESNSKATYKPHTHQSKLFVFSIWALPSVFMLALMLVMWPATHRLEPRDPIYSDKKPITIQVISTRWKWVFIYPDQNIATVNFVNIPLNTPVTFELTADEAPMSSFWIPNLGGQLYSMTGHVNKLNLIADTAGDYPGSSAEINGAGFAGMKFTARASSEEDFNLWVQSVRQSSDVLDAATYAKLVKPSENNPIAFYSAFDYGLYDKVVMKYMGSHDHQLETQETAHTGH
jgi:cytochrome o ubiquinol oxidase subunit 2